MCGLRCWAMDGGSDWRDGVCGGADCIAERIADCIANGVADGSAYGIADVFAYAVAYGVADGGMRPRQVCGRRLARTAVV